MGWTSIDSALELMDQGREIEIEKAQIRRLSVIAEEARRARRARGLADDQDDELEPEPPIIELPDELPDPGEVRVTQRLDGTRIIWDGEVRGKHRAGYLMRPEIRNPRRILWVATCSCGWLARRGWKLRTGAEDSWRSHVRRHS